MLVDVKKEADAQHIGNLLHAYAASDFASRSTAVVFKTPAQLLGRVLDELSPFRMLQESLKVRFGFKVGAC